MDEYPQHTIEHNGLEHLVDSKPVPTQYTLTSSDPSITDWTGREPIRRTKLDQVRDALLERQSRPLTQAQKKRRLKEKARKKANKINKVRQ